MSYVWGHKGTLCRCSRAGESCEERKSPRVRFQCECCKIPLRFRELDDVLGAESFAVVEMEGKKRVGVYQLGK